MGSAYPTTEDYVNRHGANGHGANGSGAQKPPKLLDRMRQALRVKHYAYRTEQAYVQWVKRFILHQGKRHPEEIGRPEIEAFLTHLAVEGRGWHRQSA